MTDRVLRPAITFATVSAVLLAVLAVYLLVSGASRTHAEAGHYDVTATQGIFTEYSPAVTSPVNFPATDAAYGPPVTIADGGDGITAGQTSFTVTWPVLIPPVDNPIVTDDIITVVATGEMMKVTAVVLTSVTVVRGVAGSTAAIAAEGASIFQEGSAFTYASGGDPILVGQTVLVDAEKMIVTAVDSVNNILNVTRGALGVAPVTHSEDNGVYEATFALPGAARGAATAQAIEGVLGVSGDHNFNNNVIFDPPGVAYTPYCNKDGPDGGTEHDYRDRNANNAIDAGETPCVVRGNLAGRQVSAATLGLLGETCSGNIPVVHNLYSMPTPNNELDPRASTNIVYPRAQGVGDRFRGWNLGTEPVGLGTAVTDIDSNGKGDADTLMIQNYPSYLLDLFDVDGSDTDKIDNDIDGLVDEVGEGPLDPAVPEQVSGGLTEVGGSYVALMFVQFKEGTLNVTFAPDMPHPFARMVGPASKLYSPGVTITDGGDGITAGQTSFTYSVSLGDPIAAGDVIEVDGEVMLVTAVTVATNTLTVTRGWDATTAAAHAEGAGPLSGAGTTGHPTQTVLQDPTAISASPSTITDFCTPLTTTNTLFPTVGGVTRATNPPSAGTHAGVLVSIGQRDSDNDSFENAIDTCLFAQNQQDPRSTDGADQLPNGSFNGDMLDPACDTLPTNEGSYNDNDHDGDGALGITGFVNPLDNCPTVATAAYPSAVTLTSAETAADTAIQYTGSDEMKLNDVIQLNDNASVTTLAVLAANIDASTATVTYNSTADAITSGKRIVIDSEVMRVNDQDSATNTLTVTRGFAGTTAAAHNGLVGVTIADGGDGITAVQTSVIVSDATNIAVGDYISGKFGGPASAPPRPVGGAHVEVMKVTAKAVNTLTVTRGALGTTAEAGEEGRAVGRVIPFNNVEVMKVTAIDTGANTLTVIRGWGNSTAVTHTAGATLVNSQYSQRDSEQSQPYRLGAMDGGPLTDGVGDFCDTTANNIVITLNGKSASIVFNPLIANGHWHATAIPLVNCYSTGPVDADGDGYCASGSTGVVCANPCVFDAFDALLAGNPNRWRHPSWTTSVGYTGLLDFDSDRGGADIISGDLAPAAYSPTASLLVNIPAGDAALSPAVTIADGGDGITAVQTSIEVNDASGIEVGDILRIDSTGELIKVTGIAGDILTVVRGVGPTVGTAAAEGASIVQSGTTFVYASGGDPILKRDFIMVDSEYMRVTDVDTATDTVTVERGKSGTTAAAHLIAAPILKVSSACTIKASCGPEVTCPGGAGDNCPENGFDSDHLETWIGTDPAQACAQDSTANNEPSDAWAYDLNDDQLASLADVTLMGPGFNKSVTAAFSPAVTSLVNIPDFDAAYAGAAYAPAVTVFDPVPVPTGITATQTVFGVNDGTAITVGDFMVVVSTRELMEVTGKSVNTLTVLRGVGGTKAQALADGASIVRSAGTTIADGGDGITSVQTTVIVSDATGIEVGDIIETTAASRELMKVTGIAANTLTVVRAVAFAGSNVAAAEGVRILQSSNAFTYSSAGDGISLGDIFTLDTEAMKVINVNGVNDVVVVLRGEPEVRLVGGTPAAAHAASVSFVRVLGTRLDITSDGLVSLADVTSMGPFFNKRCRRVDGTFGPPQ